MRRTTVSSIFLTVVVTDLLPEPPPSCCSSPLRLSDLTHCPLQLLCPPDLRLPLPRWCRSSVSRGFTVVPSWSSAAVPTYSACRMPWLTILHKKRSEPEYHCLCLLRLSLRCACCSSVHVASKRQLPAIYIPKSFQPYCTPSPQKFLPRNFTHTPYSKLLRIYHFFGTNIVWCGKVYSQGGSQARP